MKSHRYIAEKYFVGILILFITVEKYELQKRIQIKDLSKMFDVGESR